MFERLLVRCARLIQPSRVSARPVDIQKQVRDLPPPACGLVLPEAPIVIATFLKGLTQVVRIGAADRVESGPGVSNVVGRGAECYGEVGGCMLGRMTG